MGFYGKLKSFKRFKGNIRIFRDYKGRDFKGFKEF